MPSSPAGDRPIRRPPIAGAVVGTIGVVVIAAAAVRAGLPPPAPGALDAPLVVAGSVLAGVGISALVVASGPDGRRLLRRLVLLTASAAVLLVVGLLLARADLGPGSSSVTYLALEGGSPSFEWWAATRFVLGPAAALSGVAMVVAAVVTAITAGARMLLRRAGS
jgi:hypothetical protein